MTLGVPQGSVLGLTLFLTYISDLSRNIKTQVRLFVDDMILYPKIKSQKEIPAYSKKTLTSLNAWQMAFNVDKCHIVTVSSKRKPLSTNYSLHGQVLGKS